MTSIDQTRPPVIEFRKVGLTYPDPHPYQPFDRAICVSVTVSS